MLSAHIGSAQIFLGGRSPVHIGLLKRGLKHLQAIRDRICEREVFHLLTFAHVELGRCDKAIQLLNVNHMGVGLFNCYLLTCASGYAS